MGDTGPLRFRNMTDSIQAAHYARRQDPRFEQMIEFYGGAGPCRWPRNACAIKRYEDTPVNWRDGHGGGYDSN